MTRDETASAWYRKQGQQDVAAVTVTREQHATIGRKPKFVTPAGMSVQEISLDGVSQYQIKDGPYFVACVKTIAEVAQYVDLGELQEVRE